MSLLVGSRAVDSMPFILHLCRFRGRSRVNDCSRGQRLAFEALDDVTAREDEDAMTDVGDFFEVGADNDHAEPLAERLGDQPIYLCLGTDIDAGRGIFG